MRPTPTDLDYFIGYSILNVSPDSKASVLKGQNIFVIASNQIGNENRNLIYEQDTLHAPNSSVSFEAENNLFLTGRAIQGKETKVYKIFSKRGDINFDMEANADINEITAGKGLRLLQKAQKEINELTDLNIYYEPITKGRKVVKVKFRIEQKNPMERMLAGATANDRLGELE